MQYGIGFVVYESPNVASVGLLLGMIGGAHFGSERTGVAGKINPLQTNGTSAGIGDINACAIRRARRTPVFRLGRNKLQRQGVVRREGL